MVQGLIIDAIGQDSISVDNIQELMYTASTLNSELLWDKSIAKAKLKYETTACSEDLLQLCYGYYGKLGNCLSRRDKEQGNNTVDLGLAAAELLSHDVAYASTANALLAAFNGMSIGLSPMKGMFLGPKSDKQVNKSLELDPNNAIGWLQKASSQYNTPRMFGGSVKKSIESFKTSIVYFEEDASKPQWMKMEAMVWLGQAYHDLGDYQQAYDTYKAILEIAPGYKWVDQTLLPMTLAKLSK